MATRAAESNTIFLMGKRQDYVLKQQGKEAFFAGNYIDAIAKFTEAISLAPKDPNLYGLRCAAFNKNLQYDKALLDVDKMLELRPYNYQAYLMKGSCHFGLNQTEHGIEAYKKALQSKPTPRIGQYINKALKKLADAKKR